MPNIYQINSKHVLIVYRVNSNTSMNFVTEIKPKDPQPRIKRSSAPEILKKSLLINDSKTAQLWLQKVDCIFIARVFIVGFKFLRFFLVGVTQ